MESRVLLLFILNLAILFNTQAQSNYYDYTESDRRSIFYDDFSTNNYGWYTGFNENCRKNEYFTGYYQLTSICSGHYTGCNFNTNNGFYIDQTKNFEIETSMQFVSGEDNGANGLSWGQGTNQDDRFYFQFSGNGQYRIDKRANGSWINYKPWTVSSMVSKNNYNKLTIRKVDNQYYFFINEGLVHTCPFEPFFGQQLKFQVHNNSVLRVDYIKISQLNPKQTVKADYTAPEIEIYEPTVSRGYKITESNKQVFVRGKATDNAGIYEVKINGVDAQLNSSGEFSQTIKLAIGDNTINIKATDINNNSAVYTFYVNRQGQENEQVVINDEPNVVNEKRIALVIGNSNYGGGQFLKNPVNDANLMAQTLQSLGFEVIKRTDANKQSIELAIREFSRKLPSYNIALFYFAGHGVQVDGINYLIPTDAQLNDKADCKYEAVSVNFVVEEFEKYPDNTNIVILDACRNNPFRSWTRGGERGFKAIAPTSGTIIAFATSEGATASDGVGKNGLFTQELVKQMKMPQSIENVFKKTRVEVEKLSNKAQSPQEWTKLKGDFWFAK